MDQNMGEKISTWLTVTFRVGVILLGLSTLFLFANLTTDFYDTPKFLSLSAFVVILLILSTLKFISEGQVVLKITPLDLPLVGLLTISVISTLMSSAKYVSILGNSAKVHGGLGSLVIYVLLYFLLVNNLKRLKDVKPVISTLVLGGAVLAILALLAYFGVKVFPFDFAQGVNFTLTGSSFATAAVLAILLPFPILNLLKASSPAERLLNLAVATIFSLTIALLGSTPTFVAAGAVLLLSLLISRKNLASLRLLAIPTLVAIIVFVLSQLPGATNLLRDKAQNFPRQIQLPFDVSWSISVSAFRDSPWFGSGPATYSFDFTTYKPIAFNQSPFWNLRFETAFNEYLHTLATLGGLGLGLLLILTLVYLTSSSKTLKHYQTSAENPMEAALALAGLAFFILLALHTSTLVTLVVGIIILASFMGTNPTLTKEVRLRLGAIRTSSEGLSLDILPAFLLLVVLALTALGGFYIGRFALADVNHRQALQAVAANKGLEAYNQLVRAEKLNPYHDLYRTDLAQTNFALANAIATAKGPTEASPAGSLTEEDKKNIQTLLQQAIAEGRAAAALSPKSARNWEVLGSIYRQISGVAQNALQFALDSYGRAVQLDPLNPILRLTVGGIYYSTKNYDLAVRFFTDSVNLKPDYANGYYNLSIALRDKGDLKNAQATAEKMVSLVDPKSPDYKIATDYLKDLKDRIATGSAAESAITPPAAQQTSPLQTNQPNKVLNLPKPENIATPPAVKK